MQVGDLVWSLTIANLDPRMMLSRRLAVIIDIDKRWLDANKYTITLVACGNTGKTSEKYLEPFDLDKSVKN